MTNERKQSEEPSAVARFLKAVFRWLLPVSTDVVGGQRVLLYTSFPKAFYFYLIWLPGFLVLALNRMGVISDTQVIWWMFAFCFIAYLVIAEDTGPKSFLILLLSMVTAVVLYKGGWLDWTGLPKLVGALGRIQQTLDPATVTILNTALLAIWVIVYLFAVTWKKRELSSLRRAKLRPPLGRRPLPIVGRVVDNRVRDVFELFFGFGAYDVEISSPGGRTIDVDKNCVGLALRLREFNDIISHIPTREEEDVAAADAGDDFA
jgi:hypothetical protein